MWPLVKGKMLFAFPDCRWRAFCVRYQAKCRSAKKHDSGSCLLNFYNITFLSVPYAQSTIRYKFESRIFDCAAFRHLLFAANLSYKLQFHSLVFGSALYWLN